MPSPQSCIGYNKISSATRTVGQPCKRYFWYKNCLDKAGPGAIRSISLLNTPELIWAPTSWLALYTCTLTPHLCPVVIITRLLNTGWWMLQWIKASPRTAACASHSVRRGGARPLPRTTLRRTPLPTILRPTHLKLQLSYTYVFVMLLLKYISMTN